MVVVLACFNQQRPNNSGACNSGATVRWNVHHGPHGHSSRDHFSNKVC